jgi:hypothetical protein
MIAKDYETVERLVTGIKKIIKPLLNTMNVHGMLDETARAIAGQLSETNAKKLFHRFFYNPRQDDWTYPLIKGQEPLDKAIIKEIETELPKRARLLQQLYVSVMARRTKSKKPDAQKENSDELSLEAKAIAFLKMNPTETVTGVARAVGCTRQQLYNLDDFQRIRPILRNAARQKMKGGKDTATGHMDDISES